MFLVLGGSCLVENSREVGGTRLLEGLRCANRGLDIPESEGRLSPLDGVEFRRVVEDDRALVLVLGYRANNLEDISVAVIEESLRELREWRRHISQVDNDNLLSLEEIAQRFEEVAHGLAALEPGPTTELHPEVV